MVLIVWPTVGAAAPFMRRRHLSTHKFFLSPFSALDDLVCDGKNRHDDAD